MQLLSDMMAQEAFNKQAAAAGYVYRDGSYHPAASVARYEAIPRNSRTDTMAPELTRSQVESQLQQTQMRSTTGNQQNFAIDQQNFAINQQQGLLNDNRQQQALALGQRNAAVNDALNNAQRTTGPGQSVYDQRLQQMMNGSFAPDDPSYQWRVQQGMTNLGRSQAAKGMLGSGNMAAELLAYGQGMASQEYGAQFNRLLSASQNATAQYTNAYSVLNQMMQQQQGQQQQGNANQLTAQGWGQTAQGWGQTAQGWGSQNLGTTNADTSRYGVTSNAANQAGQLGLQRDQFNAQQTRLDNADRGSGDALMRGAGAYGGSSAGQAYVQPAPTYGYQSPSSGGSVQNNVASQLPSGTGYITNNQTGQTTQFGQTSPFTNDYGYEAVYGD